MTCINKPSISVDSVKFSGRFTRKTHRAGIPAGIFLASMALAGVGNAQAADTLSWTQAATAGAVQTSKQPLVQDLPRNPLLGNIQGSLVQQLSPVSDNDILGPIFVRVVPDNPSDEVLNRLAEMALADLSPNAHGVVILLNADELRQHHSQAQGRDDDDDIAYGVPSNMIAVAVDPHLSERFLQKLQDPAIEARIPEALKGAFQSLKAQAKENPIKLQQDFDKFMSEQILPIIDGQGQRIYEQKFAEMTQDMVSRLKTLNQKGFKDCLQEERDMGLLVSFLKWAGITVGGIVALAVGGTVLSRRRWDRY